MKSVFALPLIIAIVAGTAPVFADGRSRPVDAPEEARIETGSLDPAIREKSDLVLSLGTVTSPNEAQSEILERPVLSLAGLEVGERNGRPILVSPSFPGEKKAIMLNVGVTW